MSQGPAWTQDRASLQRNSTEQGTDESAIGEPIPEELWQELKTELEQRAADCQWFVKEFPHWRDQTQGYVKELQEIADSIDEYHRGASIASVTGSSAGVLGGILSISGIIASPFTSGTSLGLSALGAGLSATGATTNLTAGVTESVRQSQKQKRVDEMVNQYNEYCKRMSTYLLGICGAIKSWSQKLRAEIMKYTSSEGLSDYLNGACGAANCRQPDAGDAGEPGTVPVSKKARRATTAGQRTEILQQLFSGSPPLLYTAFKAISGILSAILMVTNIYGIAKNSIDLSRGSKTEVAMNIRVTAMKMEDELTAYEDINEFLKVMLEVD
ncbi:apolipoprotein L3-like [Scyliorhinus canicula]|uniref:apolipoprotein L3-like n=1 Tax=Scyliorhinus canicula TaxID=7830 RepID=UPI0018F36114|nr:apolipoprotein L3-like [Scyliorhinus canicula]XP_038648929.1 apolipoprotein L3-like [Scyliorhinus canicula]